MTSKVFFFKKNIVLAMAVSALATDGMAREKKMSGSPIFPGRCADPEAVVYNGEYWVFPIYLAPSDEQTFLDTFSSPDLMNWTKRPRMLDNSNVKWVQRTMRTPAVIHANNKYYLFFGGDDVHQGGVGGVDVTVADRPEGPYKDVLGRPLIGEIVNGAQPIDQFVFKDDDGQHYVYYGGWGHCNMMKLTPDLLGLVPFPDGVTFGGVTPKNYVEGPFMLKKDGKYCFMWSEGGWTGPGYRVVYAIFDSPFGPFGRIGKIPEQDDKIARGADHHSVIKGNGKDEWYIVYHRRPLTETNRNHHETCIDHIYFDRDGFIKPVKMTVEGVKKIGKHK